MLLHQNSRGLCFVKKRCDSLVAAEADRAMHRCRTHDISTKRRIGRLNMMSDEKGVIMA